MTMDLMALLICPQSSNHLDFPFRFKKTYDDPSHLVWVSEKLDRPGSTLTLKKEYAY